MPASTPELREVEAAEAEAEAEARADAEARAELEAAAASGQVGIDRLAAKGDVDTLLDLARAYRAGDGVIGRDLGKCLAAYRAAASLGSADAKHSVALFLLTGSIVPQDLKAGAGELRAAADGGSTPAKVYLANLYEQGIHYKADAEKADVWYRSAARAAGVKAEPGTPEFTRALAELGSVRHGLELVNDPATSAGDKGVLGKKMKAYGWQLRVRDDVMAPTSTPPPASEVATPDAAAEKAVDPPKVERGDAPAPSGEAPKPTAKAKPSEAPKKNRGDQEEAEEPPAKAKRKAGATPFTPKLGAVAFLVAFLFVAIGWGAGVLLTSGARELLAHGQSLPVPIGEHLELILPIAAAALGVLPGILLYRAGTFARAVVVGALAAVAGYAAYTVPGGALLAGLELQATAFAVAGYLASALVLGLFGGSRFKPPGPPPKMGLGYPGEG